MSTPGRTNQQPTTHQWHRTELQLKHFLGLKDDGGLVGGQWWLLMINSCQWWPMMVFALIDHYPCWLPVMLTHGWSLTVDSDGLFWFASLMVGSLIWDAQLGSPEGSGQPLGLQPSKQRTNQLTNQGNLVTNHDKSWPRQTMLNHGWLVV